jgi:hypothetical protein
MIEGKLVVPIKRAALESPNRSRFTRHIDRLIMKSGKQQNVIAREMGYDRPNIISMFKVGTSRVPLDRVPALAEAVGVDPVGLVNMWLAEYEPNLLKVLEGSVGMTLTDAERELVGNARQMFPGGVPAFDERHEQAFKNLAASEAANWAALDRDIEASAKRHKTTDRPGLNDASPGTAATTPDVTPPAGESAGEGREIAGGSSGGADAPAALEAPQPPLPPLHDPDASGVLSQRYREASLMAIARVAKAKGMTPKQLLSLALASFGVELHPADLAARTPVRRRIDEV